MQVRTAVPLAPLTTLRLGGPAARMVGLDREADVVDLARAARDGEPVFVLGGGSNVVVADEGFAGTVACMRLRGVGVARAGERVLVDVAAGEDWDDLVARAGDEGWAGLECMSGIPGRVGATPIQNVGAYGQEVSDTIVRVRAFDREAQDFVHLDPAACGFGYRASIFKGADRWIVVGVRFALRAESEAPVPAYAELLAALGAGGGDRVPLRRVRETVVALRRRKGMVLDATDPESVSAGSFFVNPVVEAATLERVEARAGEPPPRFAAGPGRYKLAAAWLVERAGFSKGWGSGAIGVSRKHALALVHRGGGTARELVTLARTIRDAVEARFGVRLRPEPVFVGCSWEE